MTDPGRIDGAARYYFDIHQGKKPLPPTPAEIGGAGLDEAYAIQEALQALLLAERGPIAGYKIALTTPVMQALMGVDQPVAGAIFANTVHRSPAALRHGDYQRIAVECEIAVRLGADLPPHGRPYGREDMAEAVEALMPSIELIEDHGCDAYKEVGARGLAANNAWNAGAVLGPALTSWRGLDLEAIAGSMAINEIEIGSGHGRDVMGHPFNALAWLANTLIARDRPLRRGMIVLTGSVVSTKWPQAGDTVTVRFAGLGEASARFA